MLTATRQISATRSSEIGTVTATRNADDTLTLTFVGRWDVPTVLRSEVQIRGLITRAGRKNIIDLTGVDALDTVAAIMIARVRDKLAETGQAEIVGTPPAAASLLSVIAKIDAQPIPVRPSPTVLDRIACLGEWAAGLSCEARDLLGFFGEVAVVFFRLMKNPRRLRITSIVNHMQAVGIDAMPIVGLLAFLVGIVLTFISGDQLQRFGAGIFIVNLLGIGVLRELGILITAIIVAGRSGSAFAAEIGTMKINQEVDAMRTIGLDPMEILVLPRILALMLMLIPLAFYADMVMISGGGFMANLTFGITFQQFVGQFKSAVGLQHLWVGMVKAPFFALVIAMVGCFHGLKVAGSAESVGQQTTQSVVQSIFLVITVDAIFAVIFSQIGW